MKAIPRREMIMELQLMHDFLPVVTAAVEKAALAYGLGNGDALKLTLATEEVFAYLCKLAGPGETVKIQCAGGGYYARVGFSFAAESLNLRSFNLTAAISPDDEAALEEMGLLIASRSVDLLQVSRIRTGVMQLVLTKEKTYPPLTRTQVSQQDLSDKFTIKTPDREEIKLFTQLVNSHHPSHLIPAFLFFPGKVVDMIAGGEYHAALAVDGRSNVAGGILWRSGPRTVECFGPYIFSRKPGVAEALLDVCIGSAGKTEAVGLINRRAAPDLPGGYFEALGSIKLFKQDGTSLSLPSFYRELQEDQGSRVWSHPGLADFLRKEYSRLVLARDIQTVTDQGEQRSAFSVFASEIDKPQGQVTLRPIWSGTDAERILDQHIKLFKKESLANIFFEMDLARAWQADLTPALLNNGFEPVLLLPYGGEGDVVIFQHGAGDPV